MAPAIEERPDPSPAAGEALVAVRAVGICGTDMHILEDVYDHASPLIPGHEFAGEIVGLGAGVSDWSLGERVVGEPHVGSCRRCALCLSGNPQICPHKRALGTWTDGAFAELLAIPAWLLHPIPAGVSDPRATLIEPLACVWHGLFERCHLHMGDRVLVIGHGPIGLLSAYLAMRAGASEVIVVGRSGRGTARLEAARALGCEVLDAHSEDVARRVAELTDGDGVGLVVETAGAASSLTLAVDCAQRGGHIVVLGLSGLPAVSLPWDRAVQSDLTLAFSFSSRASSWEAAIEVAGEAMFPAEALISDTIDLGEWERGLEEIRSGRAVKVVLRP